MPTGTPRRLALAALLALVAGVAIYVVPFVAGGGGLASRYLPTFLALYLLAGSVLVIALGAALAIAQRSIGILLMLAAALFQVGVLIGGQATLWLLGTGPHA